MKRKYHPPRQSVEDQIRSLAVDYGIHRHTRNDRGVFVRHLEPKELERIIKSRFLMKNQVRVYDAAIFFHAIFRTSKKEFRDKAEQIADAHRKADDLLAALREKARKKADVERRNSSAKYKLAVIERDSQRESSQG